MMPMTCHRFLSSALVDYLQEEKTKPEQIAVDAAKLTKFLAQIQAIQEKVNSLQVEREASQQRLQTIEVSCLSNSAGTALCCIDRRPVY